MTVSTTMVLKSRSEKLSPRPPRRQWETRRAEQSFLRSKIISMCTILLILCGGTINVSAFSPKSRDQQILSRNPGDCSLARKGTVSDDDTDSNSSDMMTSRQSPNNNKPPPLAFHHTAIKTRDIEMSIQFYSLFGFEPTAKFRAGPAKAAWLETANGSSRIELIEVPAYILLEPEGMKKRAIDLIQRQDILGQNHLALDVTPDVTLGSDDKKNLSDWIDDLNARSLKKFGKTLRIAVEPRQQIIASGVYELAFLYDADGALIELLWKQSELTQELASGWEPWDGKGWS
jgi:catechol 2,3-dioxygenase-like lactoylglutathione lyase family enzyme